MREDGLQTLLHEHCRWRTTRPCNMLNRRMEKVKAFLRTCKDEAQFLSPFKSCILRTWFQLAFVSIGISEILSTQEILKTMGVYGVLQIGRYKVDDMSHMNGSWRVSFLRNGCDVHAGLKVLPNQEFSFPTPINVDCITLDAEGVSNSASRFTLFGTKANSNTSWEVIASPKFRFARHKVRFLNGTLPVRSTFVFDYRPPWMFYVVELLVPVFSGLSMCITAMCGRLKLPRMGKLIFSWSSLLIAAMFGISFLGYVQRGLTIECFWPGIACICSVALSAMSSCAEQHFMEGLTFVGLALFSTRLTNDCAVHQDCANLFDSPPVFGISFAALGVICMIIRRKYIRTTLQMVQRDHVYHDEQWSKLAADHDSQVALRNLGATCDELGKCCALQGVGRAVRQCVQTGAQPSPGPHRREDLMFALSSLDQLYSRSWGVVDVLHTYCLQWARKSSGRLQRRPSMFETEIGSDVPDSLERWMQKGFFKGPVRAIEKALTCYGGDISRLLDICRGRILFDRVQHILDCLNNISADSEYVKIVRVKNYMNHDHNSQYSAGFRAVILNVCFDTPLTRSLHLESTVCELQLVLRQFMHARYLKFRTVRAFLDLRRSNPLFKTQLLSAAGRRSITMWRRSFSNDCSWGEHTRQLKLTDLVSRKLSDAGQLREPEEHLTSQQELARECIGVVVNSFLLSAVHAGDSLDLLKSRFEQAFSRSSAGSVFFTSKPIQAMSSKLVFQFVMVVLSLSFFSKGMTAMRAQQRAGKFSAAAFRFSALELRNETDLKRAALHSFGLLRDGCRVGCNGSVAATRNTTLEFRCSQPVHANGYYFVTAADLPNADPVRWSIDALREDEKSWFKVGASSWTQSHINVEGTIRFNSDGRFATPIDRMREVKVDYRPPWIWIWLCTVQHMKDSLVILCIIIASWCGLESLVSPLFFTEFFSNAFIYVVAVAHFMSEGQLKHALSMAFAALPPAAMSWCLLFQEKDAALFIMLGPGILQTINRILLEFVSGEFQLSFVIKNLIPHIVLTCLGFGLRFFRSRAIAMANQVVSADRLRYDAVWDRILSRPQSKPSLVQLQIQVQRLTKDLKDAHTRQYNRRPRPQHLQNTSEPALGHKSIVGTSSFCGITDDGCGIPGSVDLSHPVDSLDQLFHQALCLQPTLLHKVQRWAAVSSGLFPAEGRTEYVAGEILGQGQASDSSVKWGKVKSVDRAVEKVVRSYGQDVSRLVDICRQTIIFEEVSHILRCFEAIAADPEVELVRVKNRLDPAIDSRDSAGYRDVSINLRLITPETRSLGVETHVCEVQLIPREIHEIKSDDGHRRYVEFRNIRGE